MSIEHFDVLIVGAGLSGIGAAYHLQEHCPSKTYAVLEARESLGGTWDLFRYPGIRSDSDMYTLGYSFRPWTDAKAIADGPAILDYVRDTAAEFGIDRHIRFRQRVRRAAWSSADALWTVETEGGGKKGVTRYTCNFLYMCSGYYDYARGYMPEFPGREAFKGQLVHPQQWPENLDYSGKRVVVIGSGATAVTLVPAMAGTAEHVTMLQRSPSYVVTLPAKDPIANTLRRLLPQRMAYDMARWKNILISILFFQMSRRAPGMVKNYIRKGVKAQLGAGFDVDKHFKPSYDPWDQRVCLVPDGDLFRVLRQGTASIVTDHIYRFTAEGIRLKSGETLKADIIISATGLKLLPLGGVEFSVDGEPVRFPETLAYKGMMFSGVPNLAMALGYTNASWTLKADLSSLYVCRLLNHMDRHGYRRCMPHNTDPALQEEPLIDFSSGYVLRAIDQLPKQGSKVPWKLYQNYVLDVLNLKFGKVDDSYMEFSGPRAAADRLTREAA